MPGGDARTRFPLGDVLLREARQCVILAQDRDHRLARADRRDEGRGDAGHTTLDAKPRRLQRAGQQRRRTLLVVANLGPFPDLQGLFPG